MASSSVPSRIGAPSRFPCNDRLSNKAPAITVTTEAGYHVAAGGCWKKRHTRSGRTAWTCMPTTSPPRPISPP